MALPASLGTGFPTTTTNETVASSSTLDVVDKHSSGLRHISATISYYYLLFVIAIGCLGNLLTILIMSRKSMRNVRLRLFIIALCCSDLVFLLTLSLAWSDAQRPSSKWISNPILCSASVYVTHVSSFLSAAYTTIFTTRLFIVSNFPLKYAIKRWWATNRFDLPVIIIYTAFGLAFYSFSFWFTHVKDGKCAEGVDMVYTKQRALAILLVLDSVFTFVLPCVLITFMNASICKVLKNAMDPRLIKNLQKEISIQHYCSGQANTGKQGDSNKTEQKLTKFTQPTVTHMLLLRSTAFLLLNAPYNAMLFIILILRLRGKTLNHWMYNWFLDMLRLWYFGSFSLNFHLYCTSGKRFRNEFLKMLCFKSK